MTDMALAGLQQAIEGNAETLEQIAQAAAGHDKENRQSFSDVTTAIHTLELKLTEMAGEHKAIPDRVTKIEDRVSSTIAWGIAAIIAILAGNLAAWAAIWPD